MKRSFADSWNDIANEIRSHSGPVTEHLIKLYLFPDAVYADHWKQEVYAFIHEVASPKNDKKHFPSPEKIYKVIEDHCFDRIDVFLTIVKNEVNDIPPQREDGGAQDFVETYYLWLCDELSNKGEVSNSEVADTIDGLQSMHPKTSAKKTRSANWKTDLVEQGLPLYPKEI
ncbi:MAG: hypothetical protein FWC54_00525 [Actinomycetia bacterium]|nr:hypothetical protein [Actinomycetes bacterium]